MFNKVMFFIFKAAFIAFIMIQVGLILINVGFGVWYYSGTKFPLSWIAVFIPAIIMIPSISITLIIIKFIIKTK